MNLPWMGRLALALCLLAGALSNDAAASATGRPDAPPIVVAQEHGTTPGELRPRYQPVPPEEKSWYNASYMFGLSRSLAQSTIVLPAKAPLFLFTLPLDIVLLPFTAIGGLFG